MNKNPQDVKIGLVSYHSFLRPGGVKAHVLALHREFKKRGVISKIIVPRRERSENYGKDVILFGTSFPIPFNGTQSDFSISLPPGTIERLLKKEKFDILHFHNFGPLTYQILEKSSALNILTFHSNYDFKKSKLFKIFPIIPYLFKKIIREKIGGVIGIAPFNLDFFRDCEIPKAVIPNGIDLEKFNPKVPKLKKFSDKKVTLLFIGRIEERKGLIYLLKTYQILKKKFPNIKLIVAGEGELKPECQEFIKKQKLRDVIFEGEFPSEKIPSYYRTADIFAAPSIFGESFGIVLLEAMASGCPVVAFANQGYKRVLKGKGAEFLVKPRDYRGLAQKIEILIKNEAKRKEMREWGLKEAEKYSWDKIADRVLDFYNQCYSIYRLRRYKLRQKQSKSHQR